MLGNGLYISFSLEEKKPVILVALHFQNINFHFLKLSLKEKEGQILLLLPDVETQNTGNSTGWRSG